MKTVERQTVNEVIKIIQHMKVEFNKQVELPKKTLVKIKTEMKT